MGTSSFEIQALATWIQVTVASSYYNYNDASIQAWWFMAFCLAIQAFVLDLFFLSGLYYGKKTLSQKKAVYYTNLVFQKVIMGLVAFHGYTLYSLTRKDLVNCPFNSFIVFPFGDTFYKFDFLNDLSAIILSLRFSRFLVFRCLARDEEEAVEGNDDGEKEGEWKEEDVLKVPLLGVV